jgi:excinuclease UvrABC ATPase subunit
VIRLLHFNLYPDAQEPSSSAAPAHDNAAAASAAAAATGAVDAASAPAEEDITKEEEDITMKEEEEEKEEKEEKENEEEEKEEEEKFTEEDGFIPKQQREPMNDSIRYFMKFFAGKLISQSSCPMCCPQDAQRNLRDYDRELRVPQPAIPSTSTFYRQEKSM